MSAAFSARLIEERNKKGLTQAQLADVFGKKRSTISGYETEGKEPDFKTLCEFSEFFGVSTDYLLGLSNNPGNRDDILFHTNAKVKGSYMTLPAPLRDIYVQIYDKFYAILSEEIRSDCSAQLSEYLELFDVIAASRKDIKNLAEGFSSSDGDMTTLSDILKAQNELKYKVEDLFDRLLQNDLRGE